MKVNELLKAIGQMSNNGNVETYDLTTKEGYDKFKETVEELRESGESLFNLLGIDMDEWLDNVSELSDKIYKNSNKEDKPKQASVERKEEDHTLETKNFNRPSELLTVNQKLQMHKYVQEYVDTMIKPFNNGLLTTEQINDAYAGLFEFGCWLVKR